MTDGTELTSRVMAAYQFATPALGNPVALRDIRLHLGNVGPDVLNPLLRELNDTMVSFWGWQQTGFLTLMNPTRSTDDPEPSWSELDEGVEVNGVLYTHMSVRPCG